MTTTTETTAAAFDPYGERLADTAAPASPEAALRMKSVGVVAFWVVALALVAARICLAEPTPPRVVSQVAEALGVVAVR